MNNTVTITTPDKRNFTFTDRDYASPFVQGFIACLECFSIWKDGERSIGCKETNIKEIKKEILAQLPPIK